MPAKPPQAPPQAPQTSQAQAPQAAPSQSSEPQEHRAPPRPASHQAPHQDKAPPRPAGSPPAEGVAKADPFSAQARAEKRSAAVDSLRSARGQGGDSKPSGETATPERKTESESGPNPAPNSQTPTPDQAKPDDTALSILKSQFEAREASVREAEAKVRDAHTAAEKRAAEAEAREAKAAVHLKRLEMLRGDPVQFLTEAGITEDEFKRYLAAGGKATPEQQRLSETEKQLATMRAEMDKVRSEAMQSVAALRREREDAEFARELSKEDYTLVNTMGGLPAVRAKQAALRETLGKDVTLSEAAGQLEHEWDHGFKELLKNQAVRTKLGLDAATPSQANTSPSEPSRPTSPRTLNGSLSSTTSHKSESLAWNDWRGKKERVLRELARSRDN